MKKYLLGIFAVILAVGFSAFTTKAPSFTNFDWRDANGNNLFANKSRPDAIIHFEGCNEGPVLCAQAYEVGTMDRVTSEDLQKSE